MFKSYNYEKEYVINEFKIKESYNKNKKYYTFIVSYNNLSYPYIISNKYLRNRNLINDVKIVKNDNELCLMPVSKELNFYPLCSQDSNIYTLNLTNLDVDFYNYQDVNVINKEYNKLKMNYLNNLNYLLFNYQGFYYINSKKQTNINLFNKDIYTIDLIYQKDNYVIVPDYNQDYYFNKLYVINLDNGKKEEIVSDQDISFTSIFLGEYKDKIYLLDKKEEKEYVINLKKKKINETDFKIVKNNKLVDSTYKEIVNNNITFMKSNIISYVLIDKKLYMNIEGVKVRLSDKDITKIIKNDNDTIYYLVNDELYMYNNTVGEVLLLSYFEWNFNTINQIFISK